MFFRTVNCIKWNLKDKQELKGKIALIISSIKPYDDLWFKIPHNDPASFDYVPLALQIKGKIEECDGFSFDKNIVYFLIPEPCLKELHVELRPGDSIRLWLSDKRTCYKLEKINK